MPVRGMLTGIGVSPLQLAAAGVAVSWPWRFEDSKLENGVD